MKIFSISDLHLSGLSDKPMDVFGKGWENHFEKIKEDWKARVTDGDVVLIAGDISWGTTLDEGLYDLRSLKELKGKKVFIRGNHDYWWNGITKLRARRLFLLPAKRLREDRKVRNLRFARVVLSGKF